MRNTQVNCPERLVRNLFVLVREEQAIPVEDRLQVLTDNWNEAACSALVRAALQGKTSRNAFRGNDILASESRFNSQTYGLPTASGLRSHRRWYGRNSYL